MTYFSLKSDGCKTQVLPKDPFLDEVESNYSVHLAEP